MVTWPKPVSTYTSPLKASTFDLAGGLAADIQAVVAADYIRNLRDERIKGQIGRLKQGLYPYSAPVGYRNEGAGKPQSDDPFMAPLLRQLFELHATGEHSFLSLQAIIQMCGLRSSVGRPVSGTGGVN